MNEIYNFVLITILLISLAQFLLIYKLINTIKNLIENSSKFQGKSIAPLSPGTRVPLFREFDQNQNIINLEELLTMKPTLLLFVTTHCPTCKSILPSIKSIRTKYPINIVLINGDSTGDDSIVTSSLPEDKDIYYIRSLKLFKLFFVNEAPTGLLVNKDAILLNRTSIRSVNDLENCINSHRKLVS